jgi:hypothetical protein
MKGVTFFDFFVSLFCHDIKVGEHSILLRKNNVVYIEFPVAVNIEARFDDNGMTISFLK